MSHQNARILFIQSALALAVILPLARSSHAEIIPNLLINPGAETGNLNGWTSLGPAFPSVDNGAFNPGLNPHDGAYDFVGGTAGSSSALFQQVALSNYQIPFPLIDAAKVSFQISYYTQSTGQSPPDTAKITFFLLDDSSSTLTSFTDIPLPSIGSWDFNSFSLGAAPASRAFLYKMTFTRNSGSDIDAYIDSNSVTAAYTGSAWAGASSDHLWNSINNWNSGIPAAGTAAVFTRLSGSDFVNLNTSYASPLSFLFVESPAGMTLNQSANTMSATSQYIGHIGAGTYHQSGGSNSASLIEIASTAGSTGTYTLSGGSLTASTLNLGASTTGNGSLIISSGTATITNINVGQNSTLSLTGGSLTVGSNLNLLGGDTAPLGNGASLTIANGSASIPGTLKLSNYSSLVLSGGSLSVGILDFNSPNASLVWNAGTLTLLNGYINGISTLTIPAAGTLAGSGSIVANITLNGSITLHSLADDLSIHGITSGPGNISLTTIATLNADALRVNSLSLSPSSLTRIRPNGGTSKLNTLSLSGLPNNWTAKLDLTNNSLIVAAGGAANIPNQLKQAANLGAWNGPNGITSSSAQLAAATGGGSTATALAYATGSQFTANNGQTQFAGQSFLPTDTLVMYTLAGDANMDKSVTFADFLQLQNHYNQPGTDWQGGDYNYDGSTTFADFLILQNNYNKTLTPSSLQPATATPVPEPSTLLLMSLLLLRQRRRPLAPWRAPKQ